MLSPTCKGLCDSLSAESRFLLSTGDGEEAEVAFDFSEKSMKKGRLQSLTGHGLLLLFIACCRKWHLHLYWLPRPRGPSCVLAVLWGPFCLYNMGRLGEVTWL